MGADETLLWEDDDGSQWKSMPESQIIQAAADQVDLDAILQAHDDSVTTDAGEHYTRDQWDAVVNMMDPQIREQLHNTIAPYLDAILQAHDDSVTTDAGEHYTRDQWDAVVNMMDPQIREQLHNTIAPCSNQMFFDEYAKAHEAKYGQTWELAKPAPVWRPGRTGRHMPARPFFHPTCRGRMSGHVGTHGVEPDNKEEPSCGHVDISMRLTCIQ